MWHGAGRARNAATPTLAGVSRLFALLAAALLAGACSSSPATERATIPTPAPTLFPRGSVYVAVGASDSVGVGTKNPEREAWPVVLHREALAGTRFVNVAIPGATVVRAMAREVPEALRLAPALVTVWLNVNDIVALVPPERYERQLQELVRALRRGGATRVLVANTPPLDTLPAYLACRPGGERQRCVLGSQAIAPGPELVRQVVAAYNQAIARVVAAEGAELVDLHAAGLKARAEGKEKELVSDDGFHPSAAGHRLVAETFAAALVRNEKHR